MALPAYRTLLRATKLAFANDLPLLQASREQARSTFRKNASALGVQSPEAIVQIEHAREVARVLRENVVQGMRVDDGDMGRRGKEEVVEGRGRGLDDDGGGGGLYRLRIHEETERGDNESIKLAGGGSMGSGMGTLGGGRCLP